MSHAAGVVVGIHFRVISEYSVEASVSSDVDASDIQFCNKTGAAPDDNERRNGASF